MKTNSIFKKIKRIFNDDSKPISDIHTYWQQPKDGTNKPRDYLTGIEKSQFLLEKIKHLDSDSKILEVGCNVGRNLNHLYETGFHNLHGIELSMDAIETMKSNFTAMYDNSTIQNVTAEEFFENCLTGFDLIFTMAVLEHIHTDSNWIFEKLGKASLKYIITIEDEESISWKHFPRDYKKIFENYGFKQIEFEDCRNVPRLHKGFHYRKFEKQ